MPASSLQRQPVSAARLWAKIVVQSLAALVLVCIIAAPANAAWHRATSEHYVVHADLEPGDLRALVQVMEDYHLLLQTVLPTETQLGRKARFYLEDDARRISDIVRLRVGSFGRSQPEQSGAYAHYDPTIDPQTRYISVFQAQARLFYSNGYVRTAAPWVNSGVPAFFSTAITDGEDAFIIGAPDPRQRGQIRITTEQLDELVSRDNWRFNQAEFELAYLLSHATATFLLTDDDWAGRLENYIQAFNAGLPMREAKAQLGDIQWLAAAINARARYAEPRLQRIVLGQRAQGPITVERLGQDEVDLIRLRIARLHGGNLERTTRRLARLTRRYSNSPEAWHEYAAAEFARVRASRAGGQVFRGFGFSSGEIVVVASPYSDRLAWEAVNRALELDPEHEEARVLRAEILMGRLVMSADQDESAGFEEVRRMLTPLANDPEGQPLAAALLFQSYIEEGVRPPQSVLDLLGRAFRANTAVDELRYAYAVALSRQGDKETARALLASMLNNPAFAQAAQRALDAT